MMKKFLTRACVVLAGLSAACLSTPSALAHDFQNKKAGWAPPVPVVDVSDRHIVTPFCDGKYEAIAAGLHNYNFNAYVDLYRLNVGLPELKPAKAETLPRGWGTRSYGNHTRGETRLRDSLLLLERSQTHLSPKAIYDHLTTLNINAHGGATLDWWLNTEVTEDIDPSGCNLFTNMRWRSECGSAAAIARKQTSFDWLMTAHQMESARVAWLSEGNFWPEQVANIFDHIDTQSLDRPGINIWMAQYHHHKLFEHTVPAEIKARAQESVSRIMSCEASPVEYAIIAVGDLGLSHDYLPKGLAESRIRQDIHTLTYKAIKEGNGLDIVYHAQLGGFVEKLVEKPWASGFLFLSAPDISSAIDIYRESLLFEQNNPDIYNHFYGRGTTGVKSLIFSLPTEAIPNKEMQFTHALAEGKLDLVARLEEDVFSSGHSRQKSAKATAEKMLEVYSGSSESIVAKKKGILSTEVEKIALLNAVDKSDLPLKVRAALFAIITEASQISDAHNHRNRLNIHPEQSRSDFLDIYIRHKLFPGLIYTPYVRGYAPHRNPLQYNNQTYNPKAVVSLPPLRKNDGTAEVGFAALVDWKKLEAFAGDGKLTRVMTITLLEWLDEVSADERRKHADFMAPALYEIIRLARYEDAGMYKGEPVQKHAHQYLHKYYGHTRYAENTPYWWPSRRRGHVPF